MHYNWNRYYDPTTGRYITADPIGLDGGINLYGYVEGDPVNWADPLGMSKLSINYTSGVSISIDNPTGKQVIDVVKKSGNDTITLFQLSGHGNASSQCISAGVNCNDSLDFNLNVLSDGNKIGNIADLLNSRLNSKGEIDFAGCNNASGDKNITKNSSILLKNKSVRGGLWYQLGYENHWFFGNSSGSFGLKRTYVNGKIQ